ncbi:type II toxin-antitoxin system RelE/ParE family toxin [uncultured Pontibacter sp.]|uniref:type II toxin-antitoxin system RelE/ParE family toxin n=1 Tax=uncultured Pontibacter sp. TaxID=453356 RepID=UPI002623E68F|nr:type II toxin-antitoxin system RelE/ParE family toxin [uncultured Pontibacter sp.]
MQLGQKEVIWSQKASDEYLATLSYVLEEWGDSAADKFETTIQMQIQRIAQNPQQFPVVSKSKNVRRCVATPHNSLFFRETETQIQILTCFDNRQNPDKLEL